MKRSLTCPVCHTPVPFWRLALAVTPFYVKCPHCRSTLVAKKVFWWIMLNMLLFGTLLFATFGFLIISQGTMPLIGWVSVLIIFVIMELVSALIACNKATIEVVKDRSR